MGCYFSIFFFTCLIFLLPDDGLSKEKFLAMGTASKSGVYYPLGNAICDEINRNTNKDLTRCLSYETGGSIYNIHAVNLQQMDLAISMGVLARDAFQGTGTFHGQEPITSLRLLSGLYGEVVGLVVRKDTGIRGIDELSGHRLNLSYEGSASRAIAGDLLKSLNLSLQDFSEILEYPQEQMASKFCEKEFDILVTTIGLTAPFYEQVTNCGGVLLSLPLEVIDRLRLINPSSYGNVITIKGDRFKGNPDAVQTISMRVVLLTREDLSSETVYTILSNIYHGMDRIREIIPSMKTVNSDTMYWTNSVIPFHDGVKQFYSELKKE